MVVELLDTPKPVVLSLDDEPIEEGLDEEPEEDPKENPKMGEPEEEHAAEDTESSCLGMTQVIILT